MGNVGTRRWLRLRAAGNLLNLSTVSGLLVAVAGSSRFRPGPDGLILAEGYRHRFPIAGAFTIGNVVITRHRFGWPIADLAGGAHLLPAAVLRHEGRHATQWLACGQFFLPAYALAMLWSWWRTGNLGSANPFERWAGLAEGGYPERAPRREPEGREPEGQG